MKKLTGTLIALAVIAPVQAQENFSAGLRYTHSPEGNRRAEVVISFDTDARRVSEADLRRAIEGRLAAAGIAVPAEEVERMATTGYRLVADARSQPGSGPLTQRVCFESWCGNIRLPRS